MITTQQFKTLDDLYKFYNGELFNGDLPECIINMSRKNNTYGYFSPERWQGTKDFVFVHEISLNPDYLQRPFAEWHSTLVHEMCHLWQHEFGKPSRRTYHNKEWAEKMESIGLMPSDTGLPDGKKTGQQMTHYIVDGGRFDTVFRSLDAHDLENLRLNYLPAYYNLIVDINGKEIETDPDDPDPDDDNGTKKTKSGVRVKYVCECENKLWGKAGLNLRCNDCNCDFVQQE